MFTQDVVAEITAIAAEFGFEPAALLAVAEVESGGSAFAIVDGRREPVIRFEGHYFDRRLSGERLAQARAAGLASPDAGAIPNPRSQAGRWSLLERAAAIDRKAAYESVSWGLGQVMGAHWVWLGYSDVEALVSSTRGSIGGQARLMGRYIVKAGLSEALRIRDWAAFARGYNGPAFRKNAYDRKLAAAYRRHLAGQRAPSSRAASVLRQGDAGNAVSDLQRSLSASGYTVKVDGVFGPATLRAVKAFQSRHGLSIDGIAGSATLAVLASKGSGSDASSQAGLSKAMPSQVAPRAGLLLRIARHLSWGKPGSP